MFTWEFLLQNLIHIGAILYLICFLFRDQLMLRIFAVLGDLAYTAFYFVAADQPLWNAIIYSTLNVLINAIMIAMILHDRRAMALGDNDLKLYQAFTGMTPGDFRRLSKIGRWHRSTEPQVLAEEGKPLNRLFYVLEGEIEVRKGERIIPVDSGLFIGEIAFLRRVPASATVVVKPGSHYITWSHEDLDKTVSRHDGLRQSLNFLLSSDLAIKVAKS